MITDTRDASEPGVTKLVGSIIEDVQGLFKNQLELFYHEVQDDMRRTKEASLSLATGGLVLLLGGVFLGLTAVFFLDWMFSPDLPLWGSFGIVGGALAVLGVVFFLKGKEQFASFSPLPEKSVEALKENLQWTNSK